MLPFTTWSTMYPWRNQQLYALSVFCGVMAACLDEDHVEGDCRKVDGLRRQANGVGDTHPSIKQASSQRGSERA